MSGWKTITLVGDIMNPVVTRGRIDEGKPGYIVEKKEGRIAVRIPGRDPVKETAKALANINGGTDKVVIMSVNDTTDSGDAEVYSWENHELKLLDTYTGHEQAKGYDAVGDIEEDYEISPMVGWR